MAASTSLRSSSDIFARPRPLVRRTVVARTGARPPSGPSPCSDAMTPEPSGAGVGSVIGRLKSLDGHMGVNLGRSERSVPEKLLNASQVSSTLEQVRGGGVPQAVRAEGRRSWDTLQAAVHHAPSGTRIEPATSRAEEDGRAAALGGERGAAPRQPVV